MDLALLEEHILQLEKRVMGYQVHEMAELLADDFVEHGSSGRIFDKKDQLNTLDYKNTITYTVTDFNIKILSLDVLLATYKTLRHPDNKTSIRSSIWRRKEGKWQMVFHQGTPTTV
ncbi:DUF4440 domain-containing protein [Alkalihalobacillus sp. 1P02AB]|uniref:nuclear transport factor 2 family protein n=1 Tax=Alkalihalobacillus sp. 1P02AB TaxID=3132260 RepID=UPI0039A4B8BD